MQVWFDNWESRLEAALPDREEVEAFLLAKLGEWNRRIVRSARFINGQVVSVQKVSDGESVGVASVFGGVKGRSQAYRVPAGAPVYEGGAA